MKEEGGKGREEGRRERLGTPGVDIAQNSLSESQSLSPVVEVLCSLDGREL